MATINSQYDTIDTGGFWFTGPSPPSAGTGQVGDMYLDEDGNVWQKTESGWTLTGTNLTGPQGPTGPQGVQGPAGAQGVQGPAGATGTQGPAGPSGPQGPTGPTGPQGPAGTGINLKGSVNTYPNLPSQPQPDNDAYVTLDTGHLWVSTGGIWVDVGPFVGPMGPTGPQGPAGPTGATGAQGAQGAQGIPGPAGPAGAQGPMGPEGPRGPKGDPGDPYGTPVLAIGAIVHWRPFRMDRRPYGLCKPAIVLGVWDEYYNLLSLHVLGTAGGPVPLLDKVPTGHGEGQWHYISDCPYSYVLNQSTPFTFNPLEFSATLERAQANGHVPSEPTPANGGGDAP